VTKEYKVSKGLRVRLSTKGNPRYSSEKGKYWRNRATGLQVPGKIQDPKVFSETGDQRIQVKKEDTGKHRSYLVLQVTR